MKALKTVLFMTMLSLFGSGCALMRPTDPYAAVAIPERPENKTDAPLRQSTNLPPDDIDSLTLDQCIETALANNPDIQAALHELDAAHARYRQARSALLPSLRIESGYDRYTNDQRVLSPQGAGDAGVFSDQLLRAEAVLTVPLFSGGRTYNDLRAADHERRAQEYRTQLRSDDLVFAVSRLYYTILGFEKRIQSVQQSIEAIESHQRRVESMIEAKKAARVDLLRTNARLANLQQNMLILRNEHATLRRQLAATMATDIGSQPLAMRAPVDTLLTLHSDTIVEHALGSRGDYRAAREQLEAQARRVDIARGAFAPTLAAKSGYGIRSDMDGSYEPGGSAGLSLSMPLFEGGQNAAKLAEQRANMAAQQNGLKALQLRIGVEIKAVVMDIEAARERMETARVEIEAAKEGLRIENVKYEQGKGTISDVLVAQADLLQAETNLDEAFTAYAIAHARLQLVSGGLSQ